MPDALSLATVIVSAEHVDDAILAVPEDEIVMLRGDAASLVLTAMNIRRPDAPFCVIGYPDERDEADGWALGRSWVVSLDAKENPDA